MSSIRSLLRPLVPFALRERRHRENLTQRFGLLDIGPEKTLAYVSPGSTFGRNCRIGSRTYVTHSDIGDYSYIESDSRVSYVSMGRFSAVANFAQVGLAGHALGRAVSTHPAFYLYRPRLGYGFVASDAREEFQGTRVGNDVWIGASACVLDGVSIGDGVVVGAGAVVTSDVPDFAIVVGVPARVLRYRFDDETIGYLQELRWWDRSDGWLRSHAPYMHDVALLRAKV